jgi:hypothetical protein
MASTTMKLLVPLSTAMVAGAVALGSGAVWTSESATSINVIGGDLEITNTQDGLALNLENIKPGDTMTGVVSVSNTGTVDSTLDFVSGTATSTFSDDMLLLTVEADYDGDGTGSDYVVLHEFTGPGADFEAVDIDETDLVFDVDDQILFRFTVTLDADSPNEDQAQTAGVTFDIDQTQVDGETLDENWEDLTP